MRREKGNRRKERFRKEKGSKGERDEEEERRKREEKEENGKRNIWKKISFWNIAELRT